MGFPNEDYVNIYKQTFPLRRIAFFGTGVLGQAGKLGASYAVVLLDG
ncbi:hypothetical protein [Bacillus cereus]|nr:hypothetical protein [Bacillus cereus]